MSGTYRIPTAHAQTGKVVDRCATCGSTVLASTERCHGCGRTMLPLPVVLIGCANSEKRYWSSAASLRRVRSIALLGALLGD